MDSATATSIRRSVIRLSLDAARLQEKRRRFDYDEGMTELDQQFQLGIAGAAGPTAFFFTIPVDFSAMFIIAPEMRESPHDNPTFTCGTETADEVFITASVASWTRRDEDTIVGAVVKVGAVSPGAFRLVPFQGKIHLNFQGYGMTELNMRSDD